MMQEGFEEITSTLFLKKFSTLIWVCFNLPAMKVFICLTQDHLFKLIIPVTLSLLDGSLRKLSLKIADLNAILSVLCIKCWLARLSLSKICRIQIMDSILDSTGHCYLTQMCRICMKLSVFNKNILEPQKLLILSKMDRILT